MSQLTAMGKILKDFTSSLGGRLDSYLNNLAKGDLLAVESEVYELMTGLFDDIMEVTMIAAAKTFCEEQKQERANLAMRTLQVELRTGRKVTVPSLYQKRVTEDHQGCRHLLHQHWGLIRGASPVRYDLLVQTTMIAPSYETAQHLLAKHGMKCSTSGVRELTNAVGQACRQYGEPGLLLEPEETLAGKTVIISDDGGRGRTRLANGKMNDNGQACYDTPWREPKLFVIEVLDDTGRLSCDHLPIYGCRFGEADQLSLLREYLVKLQIDQAKEVQLVADGAPWIWNRIPVLLSDLGVADERVTQTLDYYHAAQHLYSLFERLPARISNRQKKRMLRRCKEWLWQGKIDHILRLWDWIYKRKPKLTRRELNYFSKHKDRMQYADFEDNRLMCGSGVIESAVRRVINLRFKNTSTFWLSENLEPLYFLRGAVLSKRWDNVIKQLAQSRA